MTVNHLSDMNDQDIEMFIKAFDDFMQHAETEIDEYKKREEARAYTEQFYEKKASELEVTVDYYICLLYTSPSPRDATLSRMPSSA